MAKLLSGAGGKIGKRMGPVTYTLTEFCADLDRLTREKRTPSVIVGRVSPMLARLLQNPDCIASEFRRRPIEGPGEYMLHRARRFNVIAVVWGPGDSVEPHDHRTWGAIGVLENEIEESRFQVRKDSAGQSRLEMENVRCQRAGTVSVLVPPADIHALKNKTSRNTVEIHVYGRDLVGLPRRLFSADGSVQIFRSPKYMNC
jgi:predicted metal-dependent enzyme (double-stranded beta helix superfamily)